MSAKPAQQIYTGRALGASSPQHDDVGSGDGILMGSSSKGLSTAVRYNRLEWLLSAQCGHPRSS